MTEKTIATKKLNAKDRICVSAYVTRDMHGKISQIAKSRELGISDIVREAVREYLAKQETLKAEA